MSHAFDTEADASVALRLAGYQAHNEAAAVYVKNGHKVKIVRDSWKAKYFIETYE